MSTDWQESDLCNFPDVDDVLRLIYALEDFVGDVSKQKDLTDVAREADELVCLARSFRLRAETRLERLLPVVRGLRRIWDGKSDTDLRSALLEFRGGKDVKQAT